MPGEASPAPDLGDEPGLLTRAIAAGSALVGATVLVGWGAQLPALTRLGSEISMKPNTAACFVLLAVALWRRALPRPGPDRLAAALAVAAASIGGATLLEHVSGLDLGIDQLLFTEPPGEPGTAAPARMGPPAASSFLLLGTALAALGSRGRAARVAVHVLALAVAFLALLSLVGYAYGSPPLYGIARFSGIALLTAVTLEALAIAVLLVVPGHSLVSALRGTGAAARLARRTLLYSALVPLVIGWAIARGLRLDLFDGVLAVSFLVLLLILSLTLLTWRDAVHMTRAERQREVALRERERSQEALRESEARARARAAELEAVLDAVPAAVFIARDRAATRIEANRFGARLLRAGPGEDAARGAPGRELARGRVLRGGEEVPPDELPARLAAARGVAVRDWECQVASEDGTAIHLLGNAAPLLDERGEPRGSVTAYVDITARVKAEEELREAGRRKDELLAILSHELRNPLAPIRSAAYLLGHAEPGSDPARRAVAVVERQVSHLSRLVEDLLDASRLTRGRVTLRRATLDLAEVARQAAEDHRGAASSAGLQLAVETPEAPLWVDGDATRLAQVAGNLLANAVKFTPPGGRVRVSVQREGEATAVLRVADTGIGIDRALLARLFEPFAQADDTLDRSRGGLGLGLTVVKGLVALHGGTVEARSDGLGHGAALVVRLPLAPAPAGAAAAEPRRAPGSPLRVLLVEDNADAAETLRDALELSGHAVAVAASGEEGLALARRSPPDVVLCDIGLPGLDGYGVARALRAEGALAGVCLVALTGYASADDRQRALAAGFDHLLAKPAELPTILELLDAVKARAGADAPRERIA